jgi:nitrous oxidase accessory protein
MKLKRIAISALAVALATSLLRGQVTTVPELINAINNGAPNDTILVGAGTFDLTQTLKPKSGMTIRGAGIGQTIIRPAAGWHPDPANARDDDFSFSSVDKTAYLFNLGSNIPDISVSDLTLEGDSRVYGAFCGDLPSRFQVANIHFKDFRWAAIRVYRCRPNVLIRDCLFEDAGGTDEIAAGCVYVMGAEYLVVRDCHFFKVDNVHGQVYGIKGRGDTKHCRFVNNTIEVNFSIEIPFDHAEDNVIGHNVIRGEISVPKHGGGAAVASAYSYRIHHNWIRKSSAIEGSRNGLLVDHNFFDISTNDDVGNLHYAHPSALANGPVEFHNNLIRNPGRGLFWSGSGQKNLTWRNNEVIANKTVTPRGEGLFEFPGGQDVSTVVIKDNIIQCIGKNRPLMRNAGNYAATIENNTLSGISDTASFSNPATGAPIGLEAPLDFRCGAYGSFRVQNWVVTAGGDPPVVDAGADAEIFLSGSAQLDAAASDDGAFTVQWAKDSGPGSVTFGAPNAVDTTASFSAVGVYTLRLTADDGVHSPVSDTVVVTVQPDPPPNNPPTVDAGSDQTITLPAMANLDGTVVDDGPVTVQWSATSGPGSVTFGAADAPDTSASFGAAGVYVLTLTANDGVNAPVSDSVTVTVQPAPVSETNVARNGTISAYSRQDTQNPAVRLIDGKVDTRWAAPGYPQWVEVDLGQNCTVSRSVVKALSNRDYQYRIEGKLAGGSYVTLVNRTNNTANTPHQNSFAPTVVRFVKITVTGADDYAGDWVNLSEMEIYGYPNN